MARRTFGKGDPGTIRSKEDEHLLVVLRYVEQNPLRARLVARAERRRWSSLEGIAAAKPAPWLVAGPARCPGEQAGSTH
jgi:hypothetical protein